MKKCETCYYSRESLNKDLVVCTYLDDILRDKISPEFGLKKRGADIAKYFVDLTNFNGNVYISLAQNGEEIEERVCVEKDNLCGKYQRKR